MIVDFIECGFCGNHLEHVGRVATDSDEVVDCCRACYSEFLKYTREQDQARRASHHLRRGGHSPAEADDLAGIDGESRWMHIDDERPRTTGAVMLHVGNGPVSCVGRWTGAVFVTTDGNEVEDVWYWRPIFSAEMKINAGCTADWPTVESENLRTGEPA